MRIVICLAMSLCCLVVDAAGQGRGFPRSLQELGKKQEIKRENRWTIVDWLAAKAKFRMMDQWLALHSSDTEFEMYMGGDYGDLSLEVDGIETANGLERKAGEIGFSYSIFGLSAAYENVERDLYGWNAALQLRFLGTSMQNSNLTAEYGIQERQLDRGGVGDHMQQQFVGIRATFYLLSFLGLQSSYRFYLSADTDLGSEVTGSIVQGMAFIEFSIFRVFANWYSESLELESAGRVQQKREGLLGGLQLYF